ncbi:NACHT domain-containing protein [Streptomyces sp. NPDC048231]|uniref:NACHT domain-containing protein n=1 Tax=Streptomyces sp. NPDC048231 TaxID=3365519 RepID=UPI0037168763
MLLTPTLILTAAHLLGGEKTVRVIHPDSPGWVTCDVFWRSSLRSDPSHRTDPAPVARSSSPETAQSASEDPRTLEDHSQEAERERRTRDVEGTPTDLAVLVARTPLPSEDSAAMLRRLRWGTVAAGQPLPDCQIVGFPAVQRHGPAQELELDQFEVTVLPMAGRPRPTVVCEFSRQPAAEQGQRASPLAGLSGAPVFAGGVLIGIVSDIPQGRDHMRAEAVPLDLLPVDRLPLDDQLPFAMERVTEFHRSDEHFEEQYSRAVKNRYRKIEVIGIQELGRDESRWDLDAAYLPLEVEPSGPLGRSGIYSRRRRIDDLLSGREPVVLLRGEAGAGKTTLVWWLASRAASATFGPKLSHFNGLVPFVIPMRTLRAQDRGFPTPPQLAQVAGLMTDDPPEGWARRVLEAGRAFLLVDGLDEVPGEDREAARRWLTELLEAFDHVRCMVTMRPLAVEGDGDWLGTPQRVLSLRLLSMRAQDIQKFVRLWHNAARLELSSSSEEHAELTRLEADLAKQFTKNPALRDLARTPLLCAVVCALHRRRRGLLPTSRAALYPAALDMLLGSRDALRGVVAPEGVKIEAEEHTQLLQRIAIWLVRNGQSQLTYAQAQKQLQEALHGMPRVAEQGPVERVLRHILNRSGVLQERAEDSIQFIHRTFQDYLAAKELRESDHLGELLLHATEQEWEDVIRLAAGQCSRSELLRVLDSLIEQGDKASGWVRWKLHMLAANCALPAVYLDEAVRARVDSRVKALMPPPNPHQWVELAELGPSVLPFLPPAETLSEDQQLAALNMLHAIGTSDCLPPICTYAQQRSQAVRQFIVNAWASFPVADLLYLEEVLARMRLDDLEFSISSPDLLHHLLRLQQVRRLELHAGMMRSADLEVIPGLPALRELRIVGRSRRGPLRLPPPHPGVVRLSVDSQDLKLDGLSRWKRLQGLALWKPVPVGDLFQHLAALPSLRAVQLPLASPVVALEWVPVLPQIRALTLPSIAEAGDLQQLARVFPSLARLTLHLQPGIAPAVDLTPFAGYEGLRVHIVYRREHPAVVGAEAFGDRLRFTPHKDASSAPPSAGPLAMP